MHSTFALPGLAAIPSDRDDRRPADIRISLTPDLPASSRRVHQAHGRYQLALDACGGDWLIRHGDDTAVTVADAGRTLRCHCRRRVRLPMKS